MLCFEGMVQKRNQHVLILHPACGRGLLCVVSSFATLPERLSQRGFLFNYEARKVRCLRLAERSLPVVHLCSSPPCSDLDSSLSCDAAMWHLFFAETHQQLSTGILRILLTFLFLPQCWSAVSSWQGLRQLAPGTVAGQFNPMRAHKEHEPLHFQSAARCFAGDVDNSQS